MGSGEIAILILRILVSLYAQNQEYNPETDVFILNERIERVCLIGDFKGADGITICDNPLYDRCGLSNKQRVILIGQTQALIELDPHPFKMPETIYIHPTSKGRPIHSRGYQMFMGFMYTRIHQLQ